MRFTTSSLVALLCATALSLPQSSSQPGEVITSPWSITNYIQSTNSKGSSYSFNMEGPDTPGFGGAFSTSCAAVPATDEYVDCANTQFAARLVINPTDVGTLAARRMYPSGDAANVFDLAGGNYTYGLQEIPTDFAIDATRNGQVIVN